MKLRLRKLNQRGFDHVLVAVFVVVFGAIGGTYFVLSHANPWSGGLKLGSGNLCMENMNNSNVARTTVRAIPCSSSSQAQHWTIKTTSGNNFQIVAAASNACVDDTGGGVQTKYGEANRVYVQTWPCNSGDSAQVWHWGGTGNHQLVNVRSGGCINYPSSNNPVGRLIVFTCSASMTGAGSNAQWFEVANSAKPASNTGSNPSTPPSTSGSTPTVGGSQLSVGPKGSGYCMDSNAVKQGGYVVINKCSNKSSQGWSFVAAAKISGGGKTIQAYIIKNMANGNQCLDDWGQSTTASDQQNPLRLYACKASDRGQQFIWAGDGHQLRSVAPIVRKSSSILCVDSSGGALKANNPVGFATCKTSAATNQDWYKQ